MIPAIIIAALLIIAAICAILALSAQQQADRRRRPQRPPYQPRHTRRAEHTHRRDPAAAAAPGQPVSYVPVPAAVLERVRDRLLELPPAPAGEAEPPVADTRTDLPVITDPTGWGMTAAELAGQLAAEHLGAHA